MGELGALFNPGMRHELEERQAKAARREEEGNAKDGDLRIDLESGVAVINAPGEDTADQSGRRDDPGILTAARSDAAGGAEGSDAEGSDAEGSGVPASVAADEPIAKRSTASPRPAQTVKTTSASGSPEKPAVRPRGKRGTTVTH